MSFLGSYTNEILPDYALEDEQYKGCKTATEAGILRMMLTYQELAKRHQTRLQLPQVTFREDIEGKTLRDSRRIMSTGSKILEGAWIDGKSIVGIGKADPSYFMSSVFEMWPKRKSHVHLMKEDKVPEHGLNGIAYPSWRYVEDNWKELVEAFNHAPNYEPTTHASQTHLAERTGQALANMAKRWVGQEEGRTEEDYWLTPRHIVWPHFEPRHLKHVKWLRENEDKFVAKFDITLAEFQVILDDMERDNPFPTVPMTSLPNEDFLNEHSLQRIDYIEDAMKRGVDVTTDEFESEMEEVINPIDTDHPDTVMYYTYGVGEPRREYSGE